MRGHARLVLAGVLFMAAAAAAHANDEHRGKWWSVPQIVRNLQLDEAETRQLENAYQKAQVDMIELRSKVEVEQVKLRRLMEKKDFDEAAVREQHRRQEEARSRLADGRFAFLLEVRKIVGHDRFLKLMDLRDEKRRQRLKERLESKGPLQ